MDQGDTRGDTRGDSRENNMGTSDWGETRAREEQLMGQQGDKGGMRSWTSTPANALQRPAQTALEL